MRWTKFEPIYNETFYQIRNSAIIIYDQPTKQLPRTRHELIEKTYTGHVTTHAARRIKKAADLLVQISTPQLIFNPLIERHIMHTLSFITLTISAQEAHLTAREGHKLLLAPWLLRMKRKANLTTYIWKAELQKNGQLHYHITTPSFILYSLIRDEWNTLLKKNGLQSTWDDSDGKIQNSTDVHAVYKIADMAAYLCKYLSKNDKNQTTIGKIWDCSLNLKTSKFFTIQKPLDFILTDPKARVKDCDRCTMIFLTAPILNFNLTIQNNYQKHLQDIRDFKRNDLCGSAAEKISAAAGLSAVSFLPEPETYAQKKDAASIPAALPQSTPLELSNQWGYDENYTLPTHREFPQKHKRISHQVRSN